MKKYSFIVFEGIDGSGKTTMSRAFLDELIANNLRVLELPTWIKQEGRLPFPEECREADVIFAPEPSSIWIGAGIRNELIREGAGYNGRSIAQAFALDRLILFRRLLVPLRRLGKIIVQDRNVSTSMIYQPTQENSYSLEELLKLEGNALALSQAPDLLAIAHLEPEIAMKRLAGRKEKKDDAIFEKLEMLRLFNERYQSDWFKKIWTERGTKLIYLNANIPIEEMRESARALAREIIGVRLGTR